MLNAKKTRHDVASNAIVLLKFNIPSPGWTGRNWKGRAIKGAIKGVRALFSRK
jgi:hypothetical protein